MTMSIDFGDKEKKYLKTDPTMNTTNNSLSLSYSSYLDSSFNNATFVCTVTQQLPAPYHNYNHSCSFGPMTLLPTFSLSVYPSHYTVNTNTKETITLKCTSNVSDVVLEWTNIPLEDWRYNISRTNGSIELKIFDYDPNVDESITAQCSGFYGVRNLSQIVRIENIYKGGAGNIPGISIFVFSCCILGIRHHLDRDHCSNQSTSIQNMEAKRVHSNVRIILTSCCRNYIQSSTNVGINANNDCANAGSIYTLLM